MTPTSFVFTVTMAGDLRLVGAVRLLAAQAASYAQLAADAGEGLARVVERETQAAIASTRAQNAPIEFRFSGDEDTLTVVISCQAAPFVQPPKPSSVDGISVAWNADGLRHTCCIRQPTAD